MRAEYLFNAKREGVINWGTVNFDSSDGDVAEDTCDVNNYFNADGSLCIPESTRRKRAMFWLTDPGILNIFDAPLPRPVQGNVTPGPALLKLFRDVKMPAMDLASPVLLDHFNNTMTGTDQTMEKMIQSMHESVMTYDTADVQDAERICQETLRNYGQKHDGDDVVEVRQVLKDLAFDSNKIYEKVVLPWTHTERQKHDSMNDALREDAEMQEVEMEEDAEHFNELICARTDFADRHLQVMRELAELQLRRMEAAFTSRVDSMTIPKGYKAVYNGLLRELEEMPQKTASVAFGMDNQMTDSDRTVFGHLMDWTCQVFEDDCAPPALRARPRCARPRCAHPGAARRLHRRARLEADARAACALLRAVRPADAAAHILRSERCSARISDQRTALRSASFAGNGKTLRTERLMAAFVEGWVVMSGPASAKSGMQGESSNALVLQQHAYLRPRARRQHGREQRVQLHLRRDDGRADRGRRHGPHRILVRAPRARRARRSLTRAAGVAGSRYFSRENMCITNLCPCAARTALLCTRR